MHITTRKLAAAAVTGAAYAALTMLLAPISYGAIQCRVSEVLCILPFFIPCTAWGLFAGCAIANLLSAAGIFDVVFGSLATLLAALCTAWLGRGRGAQSWVRCILAALMPVVFNFVFVGAVLTWSLTDAAFPHLNASFWVFGGQVALGEIAVQHMNAKPVPPHEKNPEIPLELERITLKAMSAELSERYQSANELLSDLEAFIHTPVTIDGESADYENPDVKPVRSSTELSRERYRLRRRRSDVVSFMSGTFGLLVLAVALFAFLWNFWLKDVFSPAERIALPNFEGSNYESIINNTELSSMYKFNVIYISDDSVEPGIVISQSPAAGRSMMVTPSGIEVDLTVNAGVSLTSVPDVLNTDYRDAMRNLRAAGFNVEIENAASDSYTKDYVIATSPVAGEQLSSGSTVYITVSAGPEIQYVSMPNLVGSTEDSAISRIESSNLSYGGSDRVVSDYEAGTVIDQSISSSESVAEHTKVYLTVSSGPQG